MPDIGLLGRGESIVDQGACNKGLLGGSNIDLFVRRTEWVFHKASEGKKAGTCMTCAGTFTAAWPTRVVPKIYARILPANEFNVVVTVESQ